MKKITLALAPFAFMVIGVFAASTPAHADDLSLRCTNRIDYTGDPRSNAEINSIGAVTGHCPTPIHHQN